MLMDRNRFIRQYVKDLRAGNAAIFAGAGLSAAAGFVNWTDLLRDAADELGLNVDRENDLVSLAQFYVNSKGQNRGQLTRLLLEEFPAETAPTENHRLLAKLPIATWWTTNYDTLIELGLEQEGKIADVKYHTNQLAHTRPNRDAAVFKMHGDIAHPSDAVLTRDDYERYSFDRAAFLNALTGDLVSKTFLFLGFSFSDPNLDRVLSHIRVRFAENQRPHYAIFKRVSKDDFEKEEDFHYAKVRQPIVIEDLKRFNIEVVLVEKYSDITDILQEVYRSLVSSTIFVSTSAYDYAPWGEHAVSSFMRKFGSLIIERNAKLVTGVGLGTGNAILGGAIVAISQDSEKKIDSHLTIRPFPQFYEEKSERAKTWTDYRKDMLSRVGAAFYLFGNKLGPSGVVPAMGMEEEFRLAERAGAKNFPIGATGSISRDLAERVLSKDPKEAGLSSDEWKLVEKLNTPVDDLDQLLGPMIELLDLQR